MTRRVTVIVGLIAAVVLLATVLIGATIRRGLSAHDEPGAIEAFMAGTMRRLAIPADLKNARNPLRLTADLLAEGRAHFADHCATCHGNDGRGQTSFGRGMYPKAPDMTLPETQEQSDGALFATIENGVRLTGMPAFGDGSAESAYGSWALVHFIRHLPKITAAELAEMEKLNPKSPEECQEMAFLAGDDEQPAAPPAQDAPGHAH